jgi:hypothetical protein
MSAFAEITVFAKSGGPLSKHIELIDGKIANDSSSCRMAKGSARRVRIDLANMQAFAGLINAFGPQEAYAIGRLKPGLPDRVRVVRADKLKGDPSVIARTKDNIVFVEGEPGLVLQDIDLKGIPEDAKSRIKDVGGVWAAVCAAAPALASAARVVRPSTSHGLRNKETGETYAGSGGFHAAVAIADAADIPRFLADMHDRLWLAGYGWGISSAAGSFLERSLVDKACGSAERLIFEGPPIIEPPLEQAPRPAVAHPGDILDTKIACPTLTDAEKEELERLKRAERARLKPHLDEARAKWSEGHIERMVAAGATKAAAHAQVDRWIDHQELSGDFPLPFDDPRLAGAAAAAVLATPDRFVLKTLADPFEGPAYGRGKAILYRRKNGSLFINSFAHGGSRYELKAAPEPGPDSGPDPADAEIERLAKLLPLKYERERKAAAEARGLRASLLDRLVAAKRTEMGLDGANGKQGRPIEFPEPELWPYEVDGAALIAALAAALAKHIVMSAHQAVAAALWVVHAYLIDRTMISPRLAIRSAVKGSGKTTCLDVLARLVPRPLLAANVSPAAIFRVIAAHAPALLIDEADTLFGEHGDENLRGVLNAGHRQGGMVLRVVGEELEPRAFNCYAATAIALIGQLPGTLADRSIDIVLARRRPSEPITAFRLDRTEHLDELARQIARWAKDNRERIGHDPVLPAGLYNRAADNWRPLLAIAEAVGGGWPEKARSAASALAGAAIDEASWTELLLSDIRDIFAGAKDDELIPSAPLVEIASATLVERLIEIVPRPWAEYGQSGKPITQNKLARLLKPLGVSPKKVGPEKNRLNGYERKQFDDAFDRYLAPVTPLSNRTAGQPPEKSSTYEGVATGQPENGCPVASSAKSFSHNEMSGCPVAQGGAGEESALCEVCGRPGAHFHAYGNDVTAWLHPDCQAAFIAGERARWE